MCYKSKALISMDQTLTCCPVLVFSSAVNVGRKMSSGRDSLIVGTLTILAIAVASSTSQIKLVYEVCSAQDRSDCKHPSFSRSKFLDSQENPAVVDIKGNGKVLRATCEGPSPLRWDIDIISILSNVKVERSDASINPHDEGSTYKIGIELTFEKFFAGFLRCEEFNGQNSVEVYVTRGEDRYEFLYRQGLYLEYVTSRYTNADHFQVPCPFLQEGGKLEIWEGAKKELMYDRELSDSCVKCACSSLAHVGRKCSSPITRSEKQEFAQVNRNGDNFITCLDAIIGKLQTKPTIDNENFTEIQRCIDKSFKRIRPSNILRYDQNMGFILKGTPNPESVYVCKSPDVPGAQLSFFTLDSSRDINASLQYWNTPGKPQGIVCKVKDSMYANPALEMASCSDVSSCGLLIRSFVGFQRFAYKDTNLKGKSLKEFELNNPNIHGQILDASNSSVLPDGIVVCQYLWTDGTFGQEIGFFFKGLDSNFYFVPNYPEEAVIQLQPYQEVQKSDSPQGSAFGFKCIISTFVLFPKIQFMVTFSNGTSRRLSSDTKIPLFNISKEEPVGLSALQQFIFIHVTDLNVNVTCSAPKRTSAEWVNATKNAYDEWKAGSLGISMESSNTFLIVAVIAGIGFLMFVIISIILYIKYTRAEKTIRDLTADEVNEFIQGSCKTIQDRASLHVENGAFPNEYTIAPERVTINENEVLGTGAHATCLRGEFNGMPVAIKMTKGTTEVEYFKSFLKEIKIMAYIGVHENVVGFMGAVVEKIKQRHCQVVVELSPYGDLLKFLRDNAAVFNTSDQLPEVVLSCGQNGLRLTTIHLIDFCSQIAAGMEFLASKKIIHGDLAARNVLVFDNYRVKIADFGLSTKLYDTANYKKKQQVPLPYRWMALESLKYLEFSTQSDVWSYGITLWEIFTLGQVPFSTENWSNEFIQQVEQGLRPPKPPLASNEVHKFMHACWNGDPGSRPDFSQAKMFFQNVLNEDYCEF